MTKAKIYLCLNYLTFPHNSCIKNETRVREAEGIFKIEVPDNARKTVIVNAQVHGVMTYITNYNIGDIKNGHGNLNFLNGFFSLFFSCLMLGKAH
jgi:hypothetical protein